jgi:rubrerythrin
LLILLGASWPAGGFAQPATPPQKATPQKATPQKATPQTTIDNLSNAIQGEANASHRYTLFAKKADEEGYRQVAKLFRAASLAESIHRKNHEKVLRELGIEPKQPEIEDVKVGATRENLRVPIEGEANETDDMYPAFVEEARRQNVPAAAQSFTYALDTEAQHLKLFKDALAKLGRNPPTDYYVGKVSGNTMTKPLDREPSTKVE